jgi:lipoprotein-anchoring transpeptidase ErfK/SrfK
MPRIRRRRVAVGFGLAALASAAIATAAPADTAAPTTVTVPSSDCQTSATATCPTTPAKAPADQILSNETSFTTWAWMLAESVVRSSPSTSAAKVGSLHGSTEDGFPEVYIVLRQRQVGTRLWAEIRVPTKRPGVTGWVPRSALDDYNRITTELVLDLATRQIRLYRDGRQLLQIPAGIGTPSTPTPVGHFWIREAFPVRGVPAYGPFAFGTSAYGNVTDWPGGGVVGLHGTDEPQLVPGRPSHGCIRVRNADILRLSRLVPVGTPLLVR